MEHQQAALDALAALSDEDLKSLSEREISRRIWKSLEKIPLEGFVLRCPSRAIPGEPVPALVAYEESGEMSWSRPLADYGFLAILDVLRGSVTSVPLLVEPANKIPPDEPLPPPPPPPPDSRFGDVIWLDLRAHARFAIQPGKYVLRAFRWTSASNAQTLRVDEPLMTPAYTPPLSPGLTEVTLGGIPSTGASMEIAGDKPIRLKATLRIKREPEWPSDRIPACLLLCRERVPVPLVVPLVASAKSVENDELVCAFLVTPEDYTHNAIPTPYQAYLLAGKHLAGPITLKLL